MTNIAARITDSITGSTFVWRLGILAEDVREGTMRRYLVHQAWSRVGQVAEKAGKVADRVSRTVYSAENYAYDQWVLSGRAWEQHLNDLVGCEDPSGFFLQATDPPLTSAERAAKEAQV